MNKLLLVGRLTKPVTLENKINSNGEEFIVGSGTIAVEDNKRTDFIPFRVYNKKAENLKDFTTTGSQIALDGSLSVYQYEKNGQKNYFTYMQVSKIKFLDSKEETNNLRNKQEQPYNQDNQNNDDIIDDMPFQ